MSFEKEGGVTHSEKVASAEVLIPLVGGVSLGEARMRLRDETTDLVCNTPDEIYWIKNKDGSETQTSLRFETETWKTYKKYLDLLVNGEEIHKLALENKLKDLNEYKIQTMLENLGLDDVELKRETAHRINVFIRYGLDTEVVKNRVISLLKVERDDEKLTFTKDEQKLLFSIFDSDSRLQVLWANVMARNIYPGSSLKCDDRDIKAVEVLVNRWLNMTEQTNNFDLRNKLTNMFYTQANSPKEVLIVQRRTDVSNSLKLAGLLQSKVLNFDRHMEMTLLFGMSDFLIDRACKTELVRFLCNLEEVQDKILPIKLPRPKFYTIGKEISKGKKGNFVDTADEVINWNVPEDLIVDYSGEWQMRYFNSNFEIVEPGGIKLKKLVTSRLNIQRWVDGWITMAHERAHLDFVKIFAEADNYGEVAKKLLRRYITVSTDRRLGKLSSSETEKIEDNEYALSLASALDEGWTVLNENLAGYELVDSLGFTVKVEDLRLQVRERRQARVVNGVMTQNHYWLGQRIVSALYMDGYRENSQIPQGLSAIEEKKLRRKRGLEFARKIIGSLDLNKITDQNSRALFENTIIDEGVTNSAERSVWENKEGYMNLAWKVDKKNKLLDYLVSTDKAKRKIAIDVLLDLFGKLDK